MLPSESLKLVSVRTTWMGTAKIVIDIVIRVHKSFWPLCTSRITPFLQSCFSSSNLHWLLSCNTLHADTPGYPRKVFSVSCEVWLCIYLLLFSGYLDLFLLHTFHSSFFSHFLLCSGNFPKPSHLPWFMWTLRVC